MQGFSCKAALQTLRARNAAVEQGFQPPATRNIQTLRLEAFATKHWLGSGRWRKGERFGMGEFHLFGKAAQGTLTLCSAPSSPEGSHTHAEVRDEAVGFCLGIFWEDRQLPWCFHERTRAYGTQGWGSPARERSHQLYVS